MPVFFYIDPDFEDDPRVSSHSLVILGFVADCASAAPWPFAHLLLRGPAPLCPRNARPSGISLAAAALRPLGMVKSQPRLKT